MIKKNQIALKTEYGCKGACEECKNLVRTRHLIQFKGKLLCKNCRRRLESYKAQQSACFIGRGYVTLDKALNRTYLAKIRKSSCYVCLPLCMAEKEFKIVLVENENKK